jgi:hypothetical protein
MPPPFRATLGAGQAITVVLSTEAAPATDGERAWKRREKYEADLLERWARGWSGAATAPSWIRQLALGADQFVARRPLPDEPAGMTVIAGYHWFGDWGRDTMISLPGLALATGRPELAARVLRTFARFVDQGMLPNRFPDEPDTPEYNTVDATLWWFEAVRATHAATGDDGLLKDLFPVLENVVEWHRRGTRYGIGVDPVDGLLHAGEPGVQLTWMDAKVGDWVSRRASASRWRSMRSGTTRCAPWPASRADSSARPRTGTRPPTVRATASTVSGTRRPATAMTCSKARTAMTSRCGPTRSSRSRCREPRCRPSASAASVDACARHLLTSHGPAQPVARRSRLPRFLRRAADGARRRLSPGHGVGLAARALRAGPRAGVRRPRGGARAAGAARTASGRLRRRLDRRDLRRRAALCPARLRRAGVVRRRDAACLAGAQRGAAGARPAPPKAAKTPRR